MISSVAKTFIGNGTNYLGTRLRGRILAVKVVADSDVTNNWDLTLTGETTGMPILVDTTVANNTTTWFFPRQIVSKGSDGSDATDAFVESWVLNERIKAIAANAGTTGEITVTVFYDSEE